MPQPLQRFYTLLFVLLTPALFAQNAFIPAIQTEIVNSELGAMTDIKDLIITDQYTSKHNQITHVYLSQSVNGVRIANSSINATVDAASGKVLRVVGKVIPNPGSIASGTANLDLQSAVAAQLSDVIQGLKIRDNTETPKRPHKRSITISGANYAHEASAEQAYYYTPENELKLAWTFDAEMPDHAHWYSYVVDASSGELLKRYDWTIKCKIEGHDHPRMQPAMLDLKQRAMTTNDGSGYVVYDLPVESPIHGQRTLETEPALAAASPFGWHDDDGVAGPEYTITRGNNVFAYEDVSDSNAGEPAEGGAGLNFDFAYNPGQLPENYQEAAITNLFFTNNKVHDIMHMYGFDEASGNFQETNYSGEGLGSDYVRAEAQDGGGTNNANFATPPDGQNPRMQMYLWESNSSTQSLFQVNAPSAIEGIYASSLFAGFGPEPSGSLSGDLVLADDGAVAPNDGCQAFTNAAEIAGNIAVVYRGNCAFVDKVLNAQDAGAVACVIINDEPGLINMGGTSGDVEIPSLMITEADGAAIVDILAQEETVNVTLIPSGGGEFIKDGSFDNGIIIHEFAHGISIRLTGGPSNVECLFNDEQMGEGWSDFYGIALTADPNAANPVNRPMATFAVGEPINGVGLRPAPYDTTFAVNGFTYGDVANENLSQPHGIGFVWATMLWDLYWAFIEEYGFDEDLYAGSGGNNMVIQLVTDGLKLQACQPGFVDGRDAILLADELLFDGAHQCLIWEVFAKRGLGFSANQGSSFNRFDGVEAFDLPPLCQEVVSPPTALFSVDATDSCTGFFQFTDESVDVPQSWLWDFGDGSTSTEQNPGHIYAEPGVYTVSLTVTNELGEDTETIAAAVVFELPEAPTVSAEPGCTGELITLTATGATAEVVWTDANGVQVGVGDEIQVELGDTPDTYFATADLAPSAFVGPENGDIGPGGNHATAFTGTVDFETFQPLVLRSAWVESGATGTRTINLWNGPSGTGDIVDQVSVDIDFTGGGTILLNFEINTPGVYSIGLNEANLFRNEDGADYPYTEDGLFSIIGSSAGPDFYYYFYNLEVDVLGCESEPAEVVTEVLGDAAFDFETAGLTVNFTDQSTGASAWSWDFGDGNGSEESDPEHTYATAGTYTVTLTVNGTCVYAEEVVVGTVGLADALEGAVVLSPNPTSDRIQVQLPDAVDGLRAVRLFDVSGRLVKEQGILSNVFFIDLNGLSSGTYMLQLLDEQRAIRYTDRVMIAR